MTPTPFSIVPRGVDSRLVAAVFAAALFAVVPATSARAAAAGAGALAIDGDLKDLAAFARSLARTAPGDAFAEADAAGDVRVFDAGVVPARAIEEHYFVNGFDQTLDLFAYDRAARTLYLGVRVTGTIGDPDGDGDPNASPEAATVGDRWGIGDEEAYSWTIRGTAPGDGFITVLVSKNAVQVHGAPSGEATFAFQGSELEVVVRDLVLPVGFNARVAVGSASDGLGEDLHALGGGSEASAPDAPAAALAARGDGEAADADAAAAAQAAGAAVASDGIAVLNRAYPSPSAGVVSFGFEVASPAQAVEIGVFDVAGRLVTRLASGPRDPGRALGRGDGRSDDGIRMAPGVYFLKSRIGGKEQVQRIVRCAQ
jgi:hypothetical protein